MQLKIYLPDPIPQGNNRSQEVGGGTPTMFGMDVHT